jgi:hypothetical protein
MSQLGRAKDRRLFRGFGNAPRRLDVDTKWLQDTGVNATKDCMSVKEFLQPEDQSEEKLNKIHAGAEIRAGRIEGI